MFDCVKLSYSEGQVRADSVRRGWEVEDETSLCNESPLAWPASLKHSISQSGFIFKFDLCLNNQAQWGLQNMAAYLTSWRRGKLRHEQLKLLTQDQPIQSCHRGA